MTAKTMAAVLAEHEMDFTYDGKQTGCSCGHWQARGPVSAHADHAAHQATALSAAGFGLVADAKAEALEEAADEAETLGIVVINPSSLRARAATVRGEG